MSMDSPLLSVVVSSYNQGRFIAECIDSILNQIDTSDFEIVLVDDASTDNTAGIVGTLPDPRLRFVQHQQNTGLVSTLNDGFAHARGEYIARIDADDRYRPYFFAETVRVLNDSPEVALVYGDAAAIDDGGNTIADPWHGIRSREVHDGKRHQGNEFLALIEENFIPAPSVLARRSTWATAAPVPDWVFPAFPATDWYLNLRMARAHQFCYLPVSLADYRLHGTNWHRQVGADPRVEATALRILDQTFAEADHAEAKRSIRSRVYARAYLRFAGVYLAAGQLGEARRCYGSAVRHRPACFRSPEVLRGIVAACVGGERYDSWKRAYARALRSRSVVG